MTVSGIVKGGVPVVAGVIMAGLLLRYAGNMPLLRDVTKGLKGDVSGIVLG